MGNNFLKALVLIIITRHGTRPAPSVGLTETGPTGTSLVAQEACTAASESLRHGRRESAREREGLSEVWLRVYEPPNDRRVQRRRLQTKQHGVHPQNRPRNKPCVCARAHTHTMARVRLHAQRARAGAPICARAKPHTAAFINTGRGARCAACRSERILEK